MLLNGLRYMLVNVIEGFKICQKRLKIKVINGGQGLSQETILQRASDTSNYSSRFKRCIMGKKIVKGKNQRVVWLGLV